MVMKSLLLLPATLLLLAVTVTAAPASARVSGVRGEVQLLRNGQPTPLKAGTAIQAGDTLAVGPESEARISLGEPASELILGPGSELRLDKLSTSSTGIENALDAAIALEKGDLRGSIGRLSDLSKFEIVLGKCRPTAPCGSGPAASVPPARANPASPSALARNTSPPWA